MSTRQIKVSVEDRATPWSAAEARAQLSELGEDSVVILGASDDERCSLTIGVSGDLLRVLSAGKIAAYVAPMMGSHSRGGRPDLAIVPGHDPVSLRKAALLAHRLVGYHLMLALNAPDDIEVR